MINALDTLRRMRRAARHKIGLGPFRTVHPVSTDFGYSRGLPIDRAYIEKFLHEQRERIRGITLEVGDDAYTAQFGGTAASRREVVHVDRSHPTANYRGDMTEPGVLPLDRFDCAVITQTLHVIYDMPAAVRQLHRSLAPGGTLLVTVPGISPIAHDQWGETWCWALTPYSLTRLLSDAFGAANVEVRSYGNVLAATAFLQGYATRDVQPHLLDHHDAHYPVIVAAIATRPHAADSPRRAE